MIDKDIYVLVIALFVLIFLYWMVDKLGANNKVVYKHPIDSSIVYDIDSFSVGKIIYVGTISLKHRPKETGVIGFNCDTLFVYNINESGVIEYDTILNTKNH